MRESCAEMGLKRTTLSQAQSIIACQQILEERSEVGMCSGTFLVLYLKSEHLFIACSWNLVRGFETRVPHELKAL
jgi:hypothetical protein